MALFVIEFNQCNQKPMPTQKPHIERKIPHTRGIDLDVSKTRKLPNADAANKLFIKARNKLLDINGWNDLNAVKEKQYKLCDKYGHTKTGHAQEGDYIRLNLPVPNSTVGDGYDWVRIERIELIDSNNKNAVIMRVRPAADPTVSDNSTAHFYASQTTNTFMAERNGSLVTVGVHPRNEVPNTKETSSLYNKLRNAVIGFMALLGASKSQWNSMVDELLKD